MTLSQKFLTILICIAGQLSALGASDSVFRWVARVKPNRKLADATKSHLIQDIHLEHLEITNSMDDPISPTGETLAFGVSDVLYDSNSVLLYEWPTGKSRRLSIDSAIQALVWSADGKSLAVLTAEHGFFFIDVKSLKMQKISEPFGERRPEALCWLAREERWVIGFADGSIHYLSRDGKKLTPVSDKPEANRAVHAAVKDVSCAQEAKRIAVRSTSTQEEIVVIDGERGTQMRVGNSKNGGFYTNLIAPHGKKTLFDAGDSLRIFDFETGQVDSFPSTAPGPFAVDGAWAPDGDRLVFSVRDPKEKLRQQVWLYAPVTGETQVIAANKQFEPAVAHFFPDAKTVLSQTRTGFLQILNTETCSKEALKARMSEYQGGPGPNFQRSLIRALLQREKNVGLTPAEAKKFFAGAVPPELQGTFDEVMP